MRIAWAGSTPSNTPIWVADQKGFFKKNGLNAEVISISASTIVIQALLTGEVDFIIAPSATLVTSKLAGADTVMVSTNLPLFIDHIMSLGNITAIEQLKGKIGGVNRWIPKDWNAPTAPTIARFPKRLIRTPKV